MRKLLVLGATLALCFALSSMAWAQKGRGQGAAHGKGKAAGMAAQEMPDRSNKGGEVRAQERAQEVKQMNTEKKSTKTTKAKGKRKAKGKAKAKGKGKAR